MPIDGDSLDRVDWGSLRHANGGADDLPDLLRRLWSSDKEARLSAYESLDEALLHQGSRYAASAPAVPFIIDVVADPTAADRHLACLLLSGLAVGDETRWLGGPPDLDHLRHEVARKANMSVDELEKDLAEWVAAAPTDAIRRTRERRAEYEDVTETRNAERWNLAAYEAVRAGMCVYLQALESADPALRFCAAYLLGWFAEDAATIAPHLARALTVESITSVAATVSIAAGLLGCDDPALMASLARRLDSDYQAERWAAAIALARLSRSPEPAVVRELYDCLRRGEAMPHAVRYEDGDMSILSALSLRHLPHDAMPDRLALMLDRLTRMPPDPSALLLAETVIKIAFPDGPLPDGTSFAELSDAQRKLVVALHAGKDSANTFWWRHWSQHLNLPPDIGLPQY